MKNFNGEIQVFSRAIRKCLKQFPSNLFFFKKLKQKKLQWRKSILREQTKEADVRKVHLNCSLV